MSTETEIKLQTGLIFLKASKVPCFLLEREEDLRTEIHTKILTFTFRGGIHIFLTEEQFSYNGVLYRKIESDAFQIARKRDDDLMTMFSVAQGKTESCLLIQESTIDAIARADEKFPGKFSEKIEITEYTKEQWSLMKERDVPIEMDASSVEPDVYMDWENTCAELQKKLASLGLGWKDYCMFKKEWDRYKNEPLSWLEEKKFELQFPY